MNNEKDLICPRCNGILKITNLLDNNKQPKDDEFDVIYCSDCELFYSPSNMMFNNANREELEYINNQIGEE